MNKNKIFKIIAGFCAGCGIGICIGVAAENALSGILIGLGIGMCFAVAFSSNTNK